MALKQVAPGIERLGQFPLPMVNVYLAGDILFDAGTTWDRFRIPRQLKGRELSLLTLTHVHPDHQGMAREICRDRDIPLACHAGDVDAMEGRVPVSGEQLTNPVLKVIQGSWEGPPHKVSRVLEDGEKVGDFTVVHTPGHARGHVVYFRESDGVTICGDVIRNLDYLTGRSGLDQPPDMFTYDPVENRRSIRKLAALNPTVLLPGHGPAVTDMDEFQAWVAALPED
ncbi:MAG: MBL fold metallo-hydrolase [Solirubrobacterales bacterium]|nr:MBL fold metallo-hydrolase [Solirubrobacterales bacterium]MCB0871023.1 MBL fold metallo-hydrolase [Solirubrobacterales bacterium]